MKKMKIIRKKRTKIKMKKKKKKKKKKNLKDKQWILKPLLKKKVEMLS
jgi:hypothetical protein